MQTRSRPPYTSAPKSSYRRFYSDTSGSWDTPDQELDDEDYDSLGLDEDEDEFGLPSISTTRRKKGHKSKNGSTAVSSLDKGPINNSIAMPTAGGAPDSGDIAEERGLPNYPSAKQMQGKILRPQYKEILHGTQPALLSVCVLILAQTLQMHYILSVIHRYLPVLPPRRPKTILLAFPE